MKAIAITVISIVLGTAGQRWYESHVAHSPARAQFEQGYDWRGYPDQP